MGTIEICEICRINLKGHPKCDACGILSGKGHYVDSLTSFEGHELCDTCRLAFVEFFEKGGSWQKFIVSKPVPKLSGDEQEFRRLLAMTRFRRLKRIRR